MDSFSRFSSVYLVPDGTVFSATVALETTWIAQFWPLISVQGDEAFANDEFMVYLKSHGIKFGPVPSRKLHKNSLEPKHGFIRSIIIRLKNALLDTSKSILELRAVTISNDLYGSDVMSELELAKGFSKSLLDYNTLEMEIGDRIELRWPLDDR